jgi:hypothetical protein
MGHAALGRPRPRRLPDVQPWDTYVAQGAEVEVTGERQIRVRRVLCAVHSGTVGVIYGSGGALWGEVSVKNGRVEQSNFSDYRVVRMDEAPPIEVHLVRSVEKPLPRSPTRCSQRRGSGFADCRSRKRLRSSRQAPAYTSPPVRGRSNGPYGLPASALASCAATRALFISRARFARTLSPPLRVLSRSSRNGVTPRPRMPCLSASDRAVSSASS